MALAALRVIRSNLAVTEQPPACIRVVEKFRNLLYQPPPASQELCPLCMGAITVVALGADEFLRYRRRILARVATGTFPRWPVLSSMCCFGLIGVCKNT